MKVLLVNKFLYPNGGSETYIFRIGEQLVKMGHEVQYFGMQHADRVVGNRVDSYTASMDFRTGKLQKLLYPFKIIYSIEARKKIGQVLKDMEPDVVHLNNFNFQLTPSVIYEIRKFEKKSGKRIKIIYTAHDYQWVCPNHMLLVPETGELCTRCIKGRVSCCTRYRCIHNSRIKSILGTAEALLYKILKTYRRVDLIICPSEFMERILLSNSVLRGKTAMLHNFVVSADSSEADSEQAETDGEDYILYFGRYAAEKGIETLLSVCRKLPDIPFVFAGGGPLEEKVKEVSNIRMVGFLEGKKLEKVIRHARFVVFPSEWYENCPFSVMEAQMYKTPVLGADIGGTPELIQDKVTGELFESGNSEELMNKIVKLWNDKNLCRQYSENCERLPFDSLEDYCEKLLKIYQ